MTTGNSSKVCNRSTIATVKNLERFYFRRKEWCKNPSNRKLLKRQSFLQMNDLASKETTVSVGRSNTKNLSLSSMQTTLKGSNFHCEKITDSKLTARELALCQSRQWANSLWRSSVAANISFVMFCVVFLPFSTSLIPNFWVFFTALLCDAENELTAGKKEKILCEENSKEVCATSNE